MIIMIISNFMKMYTASVHFQVHFYIFTTQGSFVF